MISLVLLGVLAQSARPTFEGLTEKDPQPPPGATGAYARQSNGTVCFVVADEDAELSQLCRSEFGDFPKPMVSLTPDTTVVDPPRRSEPTRGELAENFEKHGPGSRWGVVSLAAGSVGIGMAPRNSAPLTGTEVSTVPESLGFSGIAGIGARYGLMPRVSEGGMVLPALALVGGASFQLNQVSPFLELRTEMLVLSPGGLLQPNFALYATSGVSTTPIDGARNVSLRPHFGLGLGWNWFPRGGGGGGPNLGSLGSFGNGNGPAAMLVALPAALAIAAMVFAGRIEIRYTARPISGPGSDFFSVMIGVGS